MLDLLLSVLSVVAVMFLWFRTNAMLEYAQLFGRGRWLGVPAWIEARKSDEELSWVGWLRRTHGLAEPGSGWLHAAGAFVVRGVTCPACLGLWLALLAAVAIGHPAWALAIYCAVMTIYPRI